MKNTTFISAGAGSGKTYTLTQRLVDYIVGCNVNGQALKYAPESFILTTFTRVAASEFKEKARAALYKKGLFNEAARLDQAAIGTIHSVALRLVSQYWYLLGISADVQMLPQEDVDFYISQSLAQLPTRDELKLFKDLCDSFGIKKYENDRYVDDSDFWRADLRELIDKIHSFCINTKDLTACENYTKELAKRALQTNPSCHISLSEIDIIAQAEQILAATSQLKHGKPEDKKAKIEQAKNEFKNRTKGNAQTFSIGDLLELCKVINKEVTKELGALAPDATAYFAAIPAQVMRSQDVYNKVCSYVDAIFSIAARWSKTYREYKDARHLLDFNDMEQKFYELLQKPEVADEIRSRYKVAFVDEFQDCSPLQVRIFERLSELMEHSVWVGDVKQSIYNFRGTDTALIMKTMQKLPSIPVNAQQSKVDGEGNVMETLPDSWRSLPELVRLSNTLFTKAFDIQLTPNLVRLNPKRESAGGTPLRHWHLQVDSADGRYPLLAQQLQKLHEEEHLDYKDIAVLSRGADDLLKLQQALFELKIPSQILAEKEKDSVDDTAEGQMIKALISLLIYSDNAFSKALIAYYCVEGYTAGKILSSRLRYLDHRDKEAEKKPWLSSEKLFARIEQLRNRITNQSVSAMIESLFVELNVDELLKRIHPENQGYEYTSLTVKAAQTYETRCSNLGLGASLSGFLDYLSSAPLCRKGDEEGLVLSTYHSAKGLEWKAVVLWSLDRDKKEDSLSILSGVQANRTDDKTLPELTLVPDFICNKLPEKERVYGEAWYQQLKEAKYEEEKRLMYVGVTRARDLLITTSAEAPKKKYDVIWLRQLTTSPYSALSVQGEKFLLCEQAIPSHYYMCRPEEIVDDLEERPNECRVLAISEGETPEFAPRYVQPSTLKYDKPYTVEEVGTFAGRLSVKGDDEAAIGDALHQIMCAYGTQLDKHLGEALQLAGKYGATLDVAELAKSVAAFWKQLETMYGPATSIECEVPFMREREGQTLNGEIDLIYRTASGDVLIDYKSYPGTVKSLLDEKNPHYVGKYAGQLSAYRDAMQAAGREVRDTLICYLTLGTLIQFRL